MLSGEITETYKDNQREKIYIRGDTVSKSVKDGMDPKEELRLRVFGGHVI